MATSRRMLNLLRVRLKTPDRQSTIRTIQTVATQTNEHTSLAWVHIHDQSPASYGISTWWGYHEMIPPKAPLPHEKTEIFESILDYFDHETFTICYRRSARDAPVDITKVELSGLRVAKKGVTRVKATIGVGKDLVGHIAIEDVFTKSKKSMVFDAGLAVRALGSHDVTTSNQ